MKNHNKNILTACDRRNFISSTSKIIGALSMLSVSSMSVAFNLKENLTIKQVIDKILTQIPGAPFPETVDTIKIGNENEIVKGIVTTTFASVEVIEKARKVGANFIIVHEPTFYGHTDETEWLKEDEVFLYKKSLLEKNKIAVWRFHDYLHSHKPDGVQIGVLNMLGWEKHYNTENPLMVEIPSQSLESVIDHVKSKLGISIVKYIGDPASKISKIVLMPGAWGGQNQIKTIARFNPDLAIIGEINEWETSEYVRDLRKFKGKGSLIIIGHAVSEEPGMLWMVNWLKTIVPEVKVTHIAAEDPFKWR